MRIMSQMILRGFFAMKIYRNGNLIDVCRVNNHIVNGAYLQMAHLIGGNVVGRSINRIAFGTNGTAPVDTDQMITNQFAKPVLGYEIPDICVGLVQINWALEKAENNGMGIMELGLLTGDNTLFARITREKPLWKEPDISLEGFWTFAFTDEAAALFEANYSAEG